VDKKIWWPNLPGKVVSAPPDGARVQFSEEIGAIWTVGVDSLIILACVSRVAAKNGRQLFEERKVHP